MRMTGASREETFPLVLRNGSRIGVIGGGPAGCFFGFFLLELADRVGLEIEVEIHEPRRFSVPGPGSCNMCGGIVSESLVQALATEGINLPTNVVERGIDAYVLHMEEGHVRIQTPLLEKRIAAVHRGAGPRGAKDWQWKSFDGFLLDLALGRGAKLVPARVEEVVWSGDRPKLLTQGGASGPYDLVAVAAGVNTALLKSLEKAIPRYRMPRVTRTHIAEIHLGPQAIREHFGNAMHVFLLDIPRLEFAALVPKGEYVTLCLMGRDIDAPMINAFLSASEVRHCFPEGWTASAQPCHCAPRMNVGGAIRPFADRLVFIGDCGVARLYKDGIGSAYRTAKAAALTAVFEGISARDFERRFWPCCRSIRMDNMLGRAMFTVAGLQRGIRHDCRGILRMLESEQRTAAGGSMSGVMWDLFTGSAPYRDVFFRTLHPSFWARLLFEIAAGFVVPPKLAEDRS